MNYKIFGVVKVINLLYYHVSFYRPPDYIILVFTIIEHSFFFTTVVQMLLIFFNIILKNMLKTMTQYEKIVILNTRLLDYKLHNVNHSAP